MCPRLRELNNLVTCCVYLQVRYVAELSSYRVLRHVQKFIKSETFWARDEFQLGTVTRSTTVLLRLCVACGIRTVHSRCAVQYGWVQVQPMPITSSSSRRRFSPLAYIDQSKSESAMLYCVRSAHPRVKASKPPGSTDHLKYLGSSFNHSVPTKFDTIYGPVSGISLQANLNFNEILTGWEDLKKHSPFKLSCPNQCRMRSAGE